MKKINKIGFVMLISIGLTLASCLSFKDAGRLNMVSCRNIDTHAKYVLLKKNVEYTKKELNHVRTQSIEAAIDEAVKKVEGGEYMMNARIRVCVIPGNMYNGYKSTCYYAVEGDVWGIAPVK